MIKPKRAYDPVSKTDGRRFLVEPLWPRGLTKATLHVDRRLKEAGPSTPLRKWFGHDPDQWDSFPALYAGDRGTRPEAWPRMCVGSPTRDGHIIYSLHDREHNSAVALPQDLRAKVRRQTTPAWTVARLRRSRR
jgi:uncharacterized protein YeaO (DUF488 family)